jgi:hypothetical protein
VATADTTFRAGRLLLCADAWTAGLVAQLGVDLPWSSPRSSSATRLSREGFGLQARDESRRGVGAAARCRPAGGSTEHRRPSLRSTTPTTAAWPARSAGPGRGTPAAAAGTRRPSGC